MHKRFGHPSSSRAAHPGTRAGFTLVEIALAVAIIAIACISLLGLLPAGLNTFKRAMDTTVTSLIAQRMINEVQQADFVTAVDATRPVYIRKFDDEGEALNDNTGALLPNSATRVIYHANVIVTPKPKLPGATADNQNLALVTVQVANNVSDKNLGTAGQLWNVQDAAQNGISVLTYTSIIAGNKP